MKKKSMVILIMVLIAVSIVSATDLNANARNIKTSTPDVYEVVKARAVSEWGNDHQMVLYVINQQSDALISVAKKQETIDNMFFWGLLVKWCDDDLYVYDDIMLAPIDWNMVDYEIDRQIEAMGKY